MTPPDIITEQRGFQYKHGDRPLDGFTIQRAAGRGGFGEVYYGISDGGREVALKLIHTYEQIELRGISHCMNLKSPHLVTIFDVKYGLDGRPWVIMEFVSGPSLRELLDAAPSGLGISKAAFFLREIAKSLTYLHDCGIVHRDLKPGNIFYENGYVKIGDYGLSKAILGGQNSGQTITVGTVHYMAPEIGEGHYDKGIDLYALGALLFEMLTGQVPFFGASPTEVLMKHLNAQVDLSAIEEPFATVIRKAMAKNPADRYQSAQEMVEAVFGSEHVRNSVSHFAPESLSMVAGHVSRKLPGEPSFAGSSSITSQPNREVLGEFGQRMQRLMNNGVEAAMKPCRKIGQRFDWLICDERRADKNPSQQTGGQTLPKADLIADPISAPQRRALTAVAIGLVAVGCGIADGGSAGPWTVFYSALSILGGTVGVLIGAKRIAPGLPPEPKFLNKLAVGGFAGLCAAFISLPLALKDAHHAARLDALWLAVLASVFLLNWKSRARADRPVRVDLRAVIIALILGAVLGGILGGSASLVGGIVAGIALAVQLASPWNPAVANARTSSNQALNSPPTVSSPSSPPPAVNPEIAATGLIAAGATAAAPSSPPQPFRPVSKFARVTWIFFFVGFATLALFLIGMLIAGVSRDDDEQAMMLGFSVPCALLAGLCFNRSATPAFSSFWPYLFRPVLQISCIGSIAVSIAFMAIGRMHSSDMPIAVFFTVFPAVALLVLTFFPRNGGDMSQVSSMIPQQSAMEPDSNSFILTRIAGGAGRLVASIAAMAILLAALLLALAVVADLPGLFNSKLVDVDFRNDFRQQFGNSDWPRLLRFFASIASFILAAISIAVLMQVRKRSGPIHMLRALGGAVLLFVAVMLLGRALPGWTALTSTENGWELFDQYMQHASAAKATIAAGPFLMGVLLLLWPAGRRGTPRAIAAANQEASR